VARLTLLYKSINGEAAVNIPPYLLTNVKKKTVKTGVEVYICFCRSSLKLSTYGNRMTSGGRLFQSLIVLGMELYLYVSVEVLSLGNR
jgi:hypothetical protein